MPRYLINVHESWVRQVEVEAASAHEAYEQFDPYSDTYGGHVLIDESISTIVDIDSGITVFLDRDYLDEADS